MSCEFLLTWAGYIKIIVGIKFLFRICLRVVAFQIIFYFKNILQYIFLNIFLILVH